MQRRMPKSSKQRAKLYLYTLGSDAGAMPAGFRRLSVFGWLICALALIIVSVETYAQDLEPRAFANTPVGLNFLIGGYVYSKGTVGTDPSVPITDTEIELHSTVSRPAPQDQGAHILLGAAVMFEVRASLFATALLVGVFAIFHGHAHGTELPPGQNALFYSMGFVIATGCLHALGIGIGVVYRWAWGQKLLRAAGAVVAIGGVFFMWKALA